MFFNRQGHILDPAKHVKDGPFATLKGSRIFEGVLNKSNISYFNIIKILLIR